MSTEVEFEFELNENFWTDINNPSKFTLKNIDKDSYSFLVCSKVPSDIYDITYREKDGITDENVLGTLKLAGEVDGWELLNINENIPEIKLKCTRLDNGGFVISIDNTVDTMVEIGDNVDNQIQALLLYNNTTNYMLAYAKINNPIQTTNYIRIPYNGVICGVNVCSRIVNTTQEEIDYNVINEENKKLRALLEELDDYV